MSTVIFIHGAWVTPRCWRYFAPLFADKGHRTLLPAWPFKDREVSKQLRHPDPRLAEVGIPEIVAHFKEIIRSQSNPPVLIGHSFGGLIVQLLLDQGYGAAGIVLSSVPPRGVSALGSPTRAIRKLWKLFGATSPWRGILHPPQPDAREWAVHQAQGIEMHLVPESRRIFWQLLTSAAAVDFRNPARAPLLLVACGKDRCFPVETQQRTWQRYCASPARTDFALFPDLTHLSIAEPGYEALAAHCLAWTDDCLVAGAGALTDSPEMDLRRFPSGRNHCDLLPQPYL
ncbi:MAG TPA: alpha/beta hydrolase [Bryobacteraceae bacterium]|nr:alpha/beta hydrolase [Bryobacteraceae bacterium]